MNKKILILIFFLLLFYGCAELSRPMYRSQAQINADSAQTDATKCKNYGFKVGTQGYANCMMQQDQNRAQLSAERSQRMRTLRKCLSKHSGPSPYPKSFGQILGSC